MSGRVLISGTKSGCGKTTMTCALLQAWKDQGLDLMACKGGPDYIDPMFHSRIIGTNSANLDLFLCGKENVLSLLSEYDKENSLTVIEGAMGFYDGIALTSSSSAWELARVTETPVLLVIDAQGSGVSICAEISGFLNYVEDSGIRGILLNRVSPMLYPRLKEAIEQRCGVPVMGYLPKLPECAIESRHLGLMTANEITGLKEKLKTLAENAKKTVDLEAIVELACKAPSLDAPSMPSEQPVPGGPVIAVARDEAFCFYYRENLNFIRRLGGEIRFFSPLHDQKLPECDGLYLGGGYPELYAQQLEQNSGMRQSVRERLQSGLPYIAECGGFLYLQSQLADKEGQIYAMCGLFPGKGYPTGRLRRFGYVNLTAKQDSLLLRKGETVPAHEFHYWDCQEPGTDLHGQKPLSERGWECGFVSENGYAGFPHLYFPAKPEMIRRFLQKAIDNKKAGAYGINSDDGADQAP